MLMADGSIQTGEGEAIVASPAKETVDRQARYEAWCRRGGRAIQPAPVAN
jgi:hypothetical protein